MEETKQDERSLSKSLTAALSKPNVKGILCADQNGLLIVAKGELSGTLAGRLSNISRLASSLTVENTAPHAVIIETADRSIVVKDYDSMTIALKCSREPE